MRCTFVFKLPERTAIFSLTNSFLNERDSLHINTLHVKFHFITKTPPHLFYILYAFIMTLHAVVTS